MREAAWDQNHTSVALRGSGASVTQQAGQMRRVTLHEYRRLRLVLLGRLANDEYLLRLQAYGSVDADVLTAAVGDVHDHPVVLEHPFESFCDRKFENS